VSPPRIEKKEIECLRVEQIAQVLDAMSNHSIYPIVVLALSTGMRRGELLALRWGALNLDAATVRVERSLEQTQAGLRFKSPKTAYGRRIISLPEGAVTVLRAHRKRLLEQRLQLGQGKLTPDSLVFCKMDESPLSPGGVSDSWRDAIAVRKLPKVTFHALRHSHASALISSGIDILTVSRRLGHASPSITLGIYAHLVAKTDNAAASVIDKALRTGAERKPGRDI
jgi:integrase